MTLRELMWYHQAKMEAGWWHTASIQATLININRGKNKAPIHPRKLNPYIQTATVSTREEARSALKDFARAVGARETK